MGFPTFEFRLLSSAEDVPVVFAAFLALLEAPFGPDFADSRWEAKGVLGLDGSGDVTGVVSLGVRPTREDFC